MAWSRSGSRFFGVALPAGVGAGGAEPFFRVVVVVAAAGLLSTAAEPFLPLAVLAFGGSVLGIVVDMDI